MIKGFTISTTGSLSTRSTDYNRCKDQPAKIGGLNKANRIIRTADLRAGLEERFLFQAKSDRLNDFEHYKEVRAANQRDAYKAQRELKKKAKQG